jgi:hypothetical protein
MNEFQKFLAALAKFLYSADETKLAAYFNADGTLKDNDGLLAHIKSLDATRIAEINRKHTDELTVQHDKGYKRAQGEVLSKFEDEFKAKTGFKSDKQGLELFNEFADSIKKSAGKMTDDDIKLSAPYQQLNDSIKKLEKDHKDALKSKDEQYKKAETLRDVKAFLYKQIDEANPAELSADPARAQKQKDMLVKEILDEVDFTSIGEGADKKFIPLKKDGKPLEDEHLRQIAAVDFVKTKVESTYGIKKADDKGSPPPPGGGSPAGAGGTRKYTALGLKKTGLPDEFSKGIEAITKSNLSEVDKSAAQIEFMTDYEAAQKGS